MLYDPMGTFKKTYYYYAGLAKAHPLVNQRHWGEKCFIASRNSTSRSLCAKIFYCCCYFLNAYSSTQKNVKKVQEMCQKGKKAKSCLMPYFEIPKSCGNGTRFAGEMGFYISQNMVFGGFLLFCTGFGIS